VRRLLPKKLAIWPQIAALIYPAGATHEGKLAGPSGCSEVLAQQRLVTASRRHIKAIVHQFVEDLTGPTLASPRHDYPLSVTTAVIEMDDDEDLC
jgi:hypothetical protein